MPELPEVENIRKGLLPLVGECLTRIKILAPKIATPNAQTLENCLTGKKLHGIKRRGKYLLLNFHELTLIVHLKMTGQLILYDSEQPLSKHTRAVLSFSHYHLHFNDVRKFGFLKVVNSSSSLNLALGPEPLNQNFTVPLLSELIKKRYASKRPIKSHLLDQTFIAGLGNIYADEALFAAKLNPKRLLKSLSTEEIARLHRSLKNILKEAIKAGGTTFSNYVNAHGEKGNYKKQLKVYQRANQECLVCGKVIKKIKIGGRSSYFCPTCQI